MTIFKGMGHGVRRLVSQLAIILAPLWGSGTMDHPYIMLVVPLVILVLGTIMYIAAFKKLSPTIQQTSS